MYSVCSVYRVDGSIINVPGEMNIGENNCLGLNEGQQCRVSPPFCVVLSAFSKRQSQVHGVTVGRWKDA